MKEVTFKMADGSSITIEYDENAPCERCGEPVLEASTSGPNVCCWCDVGRCRYCGAEKMITNLWSAQKRWRDHMAQHKLAAERR